MLVLTIFTEDDDHSHTWWEVAVGCFPLLLDTDKTEANVDAQFYHDIVSMAGEARVHGFQLGRHA